MSPSAWYIDTWTPRDGVAFASFRPSLPLDDAAQRTWLASFERTVNLRPPNWEPIDARPATALHAERLDFQRGLFVDTQGEITFKSLDELVEVVRRAYVASGGDVDEAPAATDDEPKPREGPVTELAVKPSHELSDYVKKTSSAPRPDGPSAFRRISQSSRHAFAQKLVKSLGSSFEDGLRGVAEDTAELFAARLAYVPNLRFRASFFEWLHLLFRTGLLDGSSFYQNSKLAKVLDLLNGSYPNGWSIHPFPWAGAPPNAVAAPSFVLHHLPLPAYGFRRHAKERLIDRLLYALSSPRVWARIQYVDELATLVLAGCTLLGQQNGAWAGA